MSNSHELPSADDDMPQRLLACYPIEMHTGVQRIYLGPTIWTLPPAIWNILEHLIELAFARGLADRVPVAALGKDTTESVSRMGLDDTRRRVFCYGAGLWNAGNLTRLEIDEHLIRRPDIPDTEERILTRVPLDAQGLTVITTEHNVYIVDMRML